MAIFIEGKSICVRCGKTIESSAEVVGFPAFVPKNHEFSDFSDAAFHKECFLAWKDHEQFQSLYSDYERVWKSRPSDLSFEEIEEWGKQAFAQVFENGMK